MHGKLTITLLIAVVAVFTVADWAWGHRDTAKPLFVAADGNDEGRCQDPAAPCRTISYAISQAGKGTQIRVAAGSFTIEDAEDLFLLVSGGVEISGGYTRADGFVQRSGALSTLTGIPAQYRPALSGRGFHVIADTKGADSPLATTTGEFLAVQNKLQKGNRPGPCVNGMVDNLACQNVDLLGHVPFSSVSAQPAAGNDIWGFVDLNTGREYVIAGFNRGTAVFDVSDPTAPREVGFVDGQSTTWRDIKVYQFRDTAAGRWRAYAYVTADGVNDGLVIIDLSGLPHRIARVNYASDISTAHNVYSTSTDFRTGLPLTVNPYLIVAGSNIGIGQYRTYSLGNPATPQFVAGSGIPNMFDDDNSDRTYMHDAASLLVTDARKDTQCVNGGAFCELLLDFNEQRVAVWDITDITDPQHLNAGGAEYAQRGYVHSGWWTEDRQFMFVHDELDEQRENLNTTLRIFSLADLRAPQLAGIWTGPTIAIDHNGYVRGNRYYMSNYKRGLTILDITNPANPTLAGRLDTYPFGDDSGYSGAWGVYPFFRSGTIAISDINSGVYLAADRSRSVAAGSIAFDSASYAATEGQVKQLTVLREGGTSGAVSADVEIVHATAASSDYTLLTPTLTWADGDGTARAVNLSAIADGESENLELLIVRLVNPAGGATLGERNSADVYFNEAGAAAELRLLSSNIEVAERGFATAVVVLQRTGSAQGPVSIDYSLTGGDATAGTDYSGATSGTLNWADGDALPKWLEFSIADDGENEASEFFELTFTNPSGATFTGPAASQITILNGLGNNLAPNAVVASSITAAENTRVTLDGSGSNDPDGDSLSFAWMQLSGPAVTLSAPGAAITEFTAPSVSSDALLQFRLTVSDPAGLSDSATANVTVTNTLPPPTSSGGGGGAPAPLAVLLVFLAALHRAIRRTGRA